MRSKGLSGESGASISCEQNNKINLLLQSKLPGLAQFGHLIHAVELLLRQ